MRVLDCATRSVAILEVDRALADAAREMEENSLAAVCVTEGGQLVGILTERDIVRAAADGVPLDSTPIEEYMTAAPVVLNEEASAEEALRLMLEGGFRHVPIVDDQEDVVGLVTMRQVVQALWSAAGLAT